MCALVAGVQTCALPISVQRHWDAPFQRLFIAVWHGSVMATATEHLAKLAVLIDAENMSPKIVSGLFKEIARSEEHTSELQSLMRISYAVFCLKKKKNTKNNLLKQYQLNLTNTI